MSVQRRDRLRFEVSRAAADLFWENGVAATSGQQIADAVGLSVRTLWRHFRSKESCAEPILAHSWAWFLEGWRRWPDDRSLEDHVAAEQDERTPSAEELDDDRAAGKMIVLSRTEPAIRTAFLMACDQAERELVPIVAHRLRRPLDDVGVRVHAATITAVVRVVSEEQLVAVVAGDRARLSDPFARIVRGVREATGGAIGDPMS
jgi:AcrR family transcriptional regulator